jgi:hypothetical protein
MNMPLVLFLKGMDERQKVKNAVIYNQLLET